MMTERFGAGRLNCREAIGQQCIEEKKASRPVQFEITDQTRIAVQAWIDVLQLKTGKIPISKPSSRKRASINQTICTSGEVPDRACRVGGGQLWHTLAQTNQSGTDL
jgi:hypothetical protein